MGAEGKRLQGEAFCARTHPGQEAAISQASDDITQQLPRQADDGWIEVVSTATGAGTSGMLVGATPNASRAAVGTPHNIVNQTPRTHTSLQCRCESSVEERRRRQSEYEWIHVQRWKHLATTILHT